MCFTFLSHVSIQNDQCSTLVGADNTIEQINQNYIDSKWVAKNNQLKATALLSHASSLLIRWIIAQ
jgi:hypothetical protein